MSPTPRAALVVAAVSVLVVVLPPPVVGLVLVAVATAIVLDAFYVRGRPEVRRTLPPILARGVGSTLTVAAGSGRASAVRLRQPSVPDIDVASPEGERRVESAVVGRRRGRHVLPSVAVRADGPLGLGRWHHSAAGEHEVLVYPDLPSARKLALAVRQGRFREAGRSARGAFGLGTDFDLVRDYQPDDDIRQVNWLATARMGRPMSNQYRIEQDRDVICLVDSGRLMGAPLGDLTRLDSAIDAATAVAVVADEVGDRCGAIAFDAQIRRKVSPRRSGADAVVRALFDVEPTQLDSDYELAFRAIGSSKRSLVLVLTDLLDEAAAGALLDAVPVIAGHHFVVVASTTDTDLERTITSVPQEAQDVYAAAVAIDVLDARARVTALLRRAGAEVVEAPPGLLGASCVRVYLSAKARARL